MLDAKLVVEWEALQQLYVEWDTLAASNTLPRMAPGWLLAWWRHLAPEHALLRAVEIRDGTELVGLAPFFVMPPARGRPVTYRLLDGGAPLAPLALAGLEGHVAQATCEALSQADPRPDLIELQGTRPASRWHVAMCDGWPGRMRPISRVYRAQACPMVWLDDMSVESWLAGRSSKFRSSMRRLRRRFEEEGGSWRMSTEATLGRDIEIFQRLHAARWDGRGYSTMVADAERMEAMLNDAGSTLIGDERFRLWMMEIDGEPIGADLYLAGGGVVVGINGGWDERWKRLSPPLLATMHTIEDSINREERRLDLGPGEGSHKMRFANDESPVASSLLILPGRHLPQTFALTASTLAGSAVRSHAKRVLKPEHVADLRKLHRGARRLAVTASTACKEGISDISAATDAPLRSSLRFTAAAAAVTAAAAHVTVTEDHLDGAPYLGVLFILLSCACLLLAALLIRRDTPRVWRSLAGVCALAIGALVWSRAVGLPQLTDDVGRWTEPLAIVAASAEAIVVALGGLALGRRAVGARFVHRALPVGMGATVLACGLAATVVAAAHDHTNSQSRVRPLVRHEHAPRGRSEDAPSGVRVALTYAPRTELEPVRANR